MKSSKVIVVGKVLGQGLVGKKISVAALGFSEQASRKLRKLGCEVQSIKDFIKKNKKLEGVKIV